MATSATGSDPTLVEPGSTQVAPGGTVAVDGQYSDSFAQSNPGMLYLDISDSSGLLSATDAAGNTVAGSGSNTIALSTSYANVNAILGSLHYTAGANSGSDSIQVAVWNQAGVETTDTAPVTIAGSGSGPTTETWTGAASGDWNNAANWSGGAVPTSGDTVHIYGGKFTNNPTLSNAVLTGETVDIEGSGNGTPLVTLNNVTVNSLLEGGNGARVNVGGTLTIGSQGTLLVTGNTFNLSGTAETILNNGLITAGTNGDLLIYNTQTNNTAAATLTNTGSIGANGGQINLISDSSFPGAPPHWEVQNSGSVTISNGGSLAVNGTLDGGQVTFNGSGTLDLQQAQAFTGGASVNGFGQGDQIDVTSGLGTITGFNNGTLDLGTTNGGGTEAIPLTGSYTLGNFEEQADTYPNTTSQIVYAAGGAASGQLKTDIVAPASGTVAQGGTLSLADVSIQASGTNSANTPTLTITAASGTLYLPGQTGSGASQITISGQTIQQLDADLQNTSYVPAAGASSDTVTFDLGAGSYVPLLRSLPVSISAGSGGGGTGGPALAEPSSESVAANGTVSVSGSYSDSFAAGNPGAMYLHISDSSGALSATNASGSLVAGSGSNSITLSTDYADVNAVLHSLTYAAGASGGSDTISFDLWNQAGQETTGSVPVTIGGSAPPTTETWTGAVSSDWNNAANWSGGAVPTSGDTVVIAAGTPNEASLSNAVLSGETITLQQTGSLDPRVNLTNVTLDSVLNASGLAIVTIGGTLTVGAQGTVDAGSGNLGLTGTAETVVNNGLIESGGGVLTFTNSQTSNDAAATLINNGSLAANGGNLDLKTGTWIPAGPPYWDVSNSGSVSISNGGNLALNGTLTGGQVMFSGAGALTLEQDQALADGTTVTGFGQGDQIDINSALGTITGFSNGTLALGTRNGGGTEAIPLTGSYTLGNFEELADGYPNTTSQIVYAAGGSASGQLNEDIVSPATGTVAQGGTLSLADVSIQTSGTVGTNTPTLTITAGSGTLYSPGQTGSGSSQITISGQTIQQLDADLQNTSYVAAAGASTDTVTFDLGSGSYINLLRSLPVSISGGNNSGGGGSGPTLSEPSSENLAANGTVAVSGSYSDSFAQGNPGTLYLGITDSTGTLSSPDASGNAVAGSGTNSIGVSTDYVDLNAILSNLHYTAGSGAGSDTIQFDIWNQAGAETTGATAVTIGSGSMASAMSQASSTMMANFATPSSSGSSTLAPDNTTSVGSSSAMLNDIGKQPTGIPLTLHS